MADDLALSRITSAISRLTIEMRNAGMSPPVAIVVTHDTESRMLMLSRQGQFTYDVKTGINKLANIPIIAGDLDGLRR